MLKIPTIRRFYRYAALALALLGVALAAVAFWFEPRRLVVRHVELTPTRWPRELDGLRVALLSDLHVGSPHWGIARLRQLVQRTNAQRPDLILLAGDYLISGIPLGTWTSPEAIADALGGLSAPLGVVAVLGNHDCAFDGERVAAAFRARGIIVLENQNVALGEGAKRLRVIGLADEERRPQRVRQTLDATPSDAPWLVLVHEPDVFTKVDERPALTLAGHTHGGQVRFPLLGRLKVASRYGERYAAGHVVEGSRQLFVTSGVGMSILPVRFGVPPELVILSLRGAAPESAP